MRIKNFLIALALFTAAGTSHADNFFVSASLGGANYQPQHDANLYSWHSQTEAVRFGYQWGSGAFSYGLETGYANMGHARQLFVHNFGSENQSERIDGFMLGGNLKYALPMGFYLSAHGGLFRATSHVIINGTTVNPYNGQWTENHYKASYDSDSTGSYVGVGVGYDINSSFGVGLGYDRYRAPIDHDDYRSFSSRVDTYTFTAEYRF
jgi:Outer membrane protein beta-barrel domain